MASEPKPYFTREQYLAFQASCQNGERYEYEDGYLYPLDASPNHAEISANLFRQVSAGIATAQLPCRAYTKDLHVKAGRRWAYPDLSVVCGKREFVTMSPDISVLVNPVLLGEVLSPSTQDYDRGGKFKLYQLLPSFREYLIVYQDRLLIEQHIRQDNGDWLTRSHADPLASFALACLPDVSLSLAEVYRDVEWDE